MKSKLLAFVLLAAALPLQAAEVEIATSKDGTKYAFLEHSARIEKNGNVSVVVSIRDAERSERTKFTVEGCARKSGLYYLDDGRKGNYWTWSDGKSGIVADEMATTLCRIVAKDDK